MINPAAIFKIKGAWEKFSMNHPRLAPFFAAVNQKQITEDTIIELSITFPDGNNLATNVKLKPEDMELFNEIKQLTK